MTDPSNAHGAIEHTETVRKTDYLFRVSMKALIVNDKDEVLLVNEHDRGYWDIPGGGMNHGETIVDALRRELIEEVSLIGEFTSDVILVEDPAYSSRLNMWQMRIIYLVHPENLEFAPGEDGDEIRFVDPITFKDSDDFTQRQIYDYALLAGFHPLSTG